ncbi:hypothetical protein KAW65_04080 [candidate division WOR-3 bacterium]|nr:hypothetical protein [candidate division WOR-3 bacterium]
MSVDPGKPRKILVVHGVQAGEDKDINSHEDIEKLILSRLTPEQLPVVRFETEMYRYENINDDAQSKLKKVFGFFLERLLNKVLIGELLGKIVEKGVDVIGDVVINLQEGNTAATIRDGLISKIESIYEQGNPLYIVAHSLGTIYAFDAVNELIKNEKYFNRNDRRTWPVQALVTLGSPIGLSMFNRNTVENFKPGANHFRWRNYWARTDPVVSGSFYGKPVEKYQIAEKFSTNLNSGWVIQDRVVDPGKQAWLGAHVSYWNDSGLGDDLISLITT